jgi:hypothetical protein
MFTVKPNKEESKILNWLKKAIGKDNALPIMQTVYIKNGKTVTCDGMRIHLISTPECLKEHEGVLIPQDKIRADTLCVFETTEDKYIPYEQVFPLRDPVFKIGVNPKFLIDALSGFNGHCVLTFYGKTEPILITDMDKENPEQKALIMPVYLED